MTAQLCDRTRQVRSAVSEIPSDLRYTAEHEWVRRTGSETVRVGITDFAQSALGDVVLVELPQVGAEVTVGEAFGEVESPKSVSSLYAPLSAKIVAVNADLDGSPELVNAEPYGGGWLVELSADAAAIDAGLGALLDADGYRNAIAE
jgi:glycine cleavage system H protein